MTEHPSTQLERFCCDQSTHSHVLESPEPETLHGVFPSSEDPPESEALRLATIGRMAGHLGFEIQNVLAPMGIYLELLRRHAGPDSDCNQWINKIDSGLRSVSAAAGDLVHLAQGQPPRYENVSVSQLVNSAIERYRSLLESQDIRTAVEVPLDHVISADAAALGRAIANLIHNAIDVMPDGGELEISSHLSDGGWELEIADSGPGIDGDIKSRIFEPFYSTKGTGCGLGLAVVRSIVAAHHGEVWALNCPEGGAALTIRLPRLAAEAAHEAAA